MRLIISIRLALVAFAYSSITAGCAQKTRVADEATSTNQVSAPAPTSVTPVAEISKTKAKCFKTDTVKRWEAEYVMAASGAVDPKAEATKKFYDQLKKDKTIPTKGCARILWLKEKSCKDNPMSGRTKEECLSDEKFLEKVDNEPYTGS